MKGGRVERKDGLWHFTDRYGRINEKAEGPVAQVSSAMHSLRARVDSKFHEGTGFIFGYGVLVPDINFDVDSPEWDREIIYDLRDAANPFGDYVRRLQKYWLAKNGQRTPKISQEELVEYLRGDFDMVIPLWKQLAEGEEALLKFTHEQYRALDRMEENKRILFTGCAGTGKTLLALEKSRRAAFEGKNVLMLCFNRFLAAKLKSDIQNLPTGAPDPLRSIPSINIFLKLSERQESKTNFINSPAQIKEIFMAKHLLIFLLRPTSVWMKKNLTCSLLMRDKIF